MQAEDFVSLIREIYPESENAPKVWIKWAEELAYFDSINGRRAHGECKTAEVYLDEYAEHLRSIRSIHGNAVAG